MALLPWDEEEKKKEDPFALPGAPVQSVQNSWQPTDANGAVASNDEQPQEQSYLNSEQKAQVDQEKRFRDAQEAEAARRAAAAEANMQAEAAAASANEQKTQQIETAAASTPKYAPAQEKDEGLWGFLKGVGAGIQQGFGSLGDIAIQGGGVLGYAADRIKGRSDAQAAQNMTRSSENLRAMLHGMKDITGRNITGTRDVDEAAGRIASGRGSAQDITAVAGKGLQAGVDATMFLNPARMAVNGVTPVVSRSSSMLGRLATNPAVRYAGRDAAFFGGSQGVATGLSTYGETGDVNEAFKNAAIDSVIGGTLQGTLDLAGNGINVAANRTVNSLRKPKEFQIGDEVVELIDDTGATAGRNTDEIPEGETVPGDSSVSFERENSLPSEIKLQLPDAIADTWNPPQAKQPVADGITSVNPENNLDVTPVVDGMPNPEAIVDGVPTADPRTMEVPEQAPVIENASAPADVTPVVDPNLPVARGEEMRALQESRAGTNQAEEAGINARLQDMNENIPSIDNVPEMESPGAERMTREQVAQRLMPKLADNSDVKQRIATAVGMGKDAESPIRDILREGGVKPERAEKVAANFDDLEKQLQDYNRLEEMNQKAYAEGGVDALDSNVSRDRSRVTRDMATTTRQLMDSIDKLEGSRDKKAALIRNITDMIGTRNASVLTSAGLLERNIMQEISANTKLAIKNPIKTIKSTFNNGNIAKDTAKSELAHWKDTPGLNPVRIAKYVVGNTYRTAMIPTTALANTRRGAVRDELTKWAYQELEGRKVSSAEAHKLAGTAGNEMEALVNTFIGVDNGMTNRGQATEALKKWKEYIRTGDDGVKAEFMQKVETHNSLADQMIAGLSKEDETRARGLMAMKNLIFPFVRTATNLMKTTVKQDLNPFAKSLLDEIRADQRGGAENAINLIKSKLVDYGIMGGAAALATSGALVYNDGDEVDKPRGWSLKVGDDKYIPVRATSVELPIALAGTAQAMARDIAAGKPRDASYYAGMVVNSLPYIDQFNTTTGAVDSALSGEDGGYAAKAFGVNMAKSFVPFSNNGVQPYVAGKKGESLNAKSVYDENIGTWLMNTVRKSYDPEFYNSLKDSRDNAGRVRTVDNQGVISNKTINDSNTAKFNDTITNMVNYGRENGLGKKTEDMFNTFDTGQNKNFKSVQDAITFLDVEEGADGKKTPQKEKLLEENGKLADLSSQIYKGFYGDTGSELLTLNGQELKSDASVPNKNGSKNSKLPLSMQSIKNAIAQTDLEEKDNNTLYEYSKVKTDLYKQLKDKSINYDQYSAAKAQVEQAEVGILSKSENYGKMRNLMRELDDTGFFDKGGIGSTKAGQTYLWNSLNALLASKGATPAANYPEEDKGFKPWGRSGGGKDGFNNVIKPGKEGTDGVRFTPVKARQLATVEAGRYTPVSFKVKLGNEIRKDKSQNYSDRSF